MVFIAVEKVGVKLFDELLLSCEDAKSSVFILFGFICFRVLFFPSRHCNF